MLNVASLRSLRETAFRFPLAHLAGFARDRLSRMRLTVPLLLTIVILGTSALAEETPNINDFARMIPLTLSGAGALYELPLPAEVYKVSTRRDLGDLALFNGTGEIVPFTLLQPSPVKASATGQQLPIFPLSALPPTPSGNIALLVRTDGSGAIVTLNTASGTAVGAPVTSYIVDATALNRPVSGFDIGLTPAAAGFIGTLRVESSDDLQQWRQHSVGAVATLSAGEQRLNRSRIEFSALQARYFRLCISPAHGAPRIDSVTPRFETAQTMQRRETARYVITPVAGKAGEYLAQSDGHMPVDRLRLIFPDLNSLAGVTILSRTDDASPWIERGCGTFYRLRRKATVAESGALEIAPTADRQWLIRVHPSGNGLGNRLPQLELGWQPHRLIFAARGKAPFCLAYGSARTGQVTLRDNNIASGLAEWEKQQIKPLPAQAGASLESGGRQALKARIPATTWRKALLWGALLSGVLVLAGMAWRLVKEMGLDGTEKIQPEKDSSVVERGQGDSK